MIITIAGDVILRAEPNYMGRHPFFSISPTKDPHRIWVKRSYAELIGELQDMKVALTRQIVQNIALTNDPKMILAEDSINISDYIEGRKVIRKNRVLVWRCSYGNACKSIIPSNIPILGVFRRTKGKPYWYYTV